MNKKKDLPVCYGIIPARYDSTRFPGKPLTDILGKPMFWHVCNRASSCPDLNRVILATDDNRIHEEAVRLNVESVITRKDHPSGTDRVLEAALLSNIPDDAVVINIQGDEPALAPEMLSELVAPFENPEVRVTTLASQLSPEEAQNPDRVKVLFSKSGRALYFSRSPIPFPRDDEKSDFFGHIGLYAFRMKDLKIFVSLGESKLEKTEKLEQLRLLENDIPIHVVVTSHQSIGVDRPEDIEKVIKLMNR